MVSRNDYRIALSFFPLVSEDFEFHVYRSPYREGDKREAFPDCKRQRLPDNSGRFIDFWVSFQPRDGFELFLARADTNLRVTVDALYYFLTRVCEQQLAPGEYVVKQDFRRRIVFVLQEHPGVGREVVWLEPYNLRSARKLGFLADFAFDAPRTAAPTRRLLQLSLSLDKDGQRNRNFYADRYAKLQKFVSLFHQRLFPLSVDEARIQVDHTLFDIRAEFLDPKRFVFGGGQTSPSPFVGVKQHGPLKPVDTTAKIYFVYRPQDKPLSYDLFRALRGDTFNTFLGMKEMFEFAMTREHVGGAPLSAFDLPSLERTCEAIAREAEGRMVVPVVITPFRRDGSEEASRQYYLTKQVFLKHGFPSQFVSTDLLGSKTSLKWSASNIALGVFAKLGGQPWKLVPRTEKCLIIGLGQAHRVLPNGEIARFFAYSVLTDSSGLYEDLRVLGEGTGSNEYMRDFKENLSALLQAYGERYQTFVIHTTFKIRREEMDAVKEVISRFAGPTEPSPEFVVMKFNDENKHFGYATANNSMVPYESSYLRLSRTEYLMWFEGLQRSNPTGPRRIERPVLVEFVYPTDGLSDARMRDCLQDALNLSGANWRGFNAKSLPISVYYAQLIARFVRESEAVDVEAPDVAAIHPWFL